MDNIFSACDVMRIKLLAINAVNFSCIRQKGKMPIISFVCGKEIA